MSIARPEDLIITEIVGDMSIVCDYAGLGSNCPEDPAEWILHRVRCECGLGGAVLACTACKDERLLSDGVVKCGDCGGYVPCREAYTYIEPLSRPH